MILSKNTSGSTTPPLGLQQVPHIRRSSNGYDRKIAYSKLFFKLFIQNKTKWQYGWPSVKVLWWAQKNSTSFNIRAIERATNNETPQVLEWLKKSG